MLSTPLPPNAAGRSASSQGPFTARIHRVMGVSGINHRLAKRINLSCLLAAIVLLFAFPHKKGIWYDEAVSMLISKGIGHDAPFRFAKSDSIDSSVLERLNSPSHVYRATVMDLGNSFPYNIGLHWFSALFGNSITVYTLFSKLSSAATIIAFYLLADLFFSGSVFTALAVFLLATNVNFISLSYEIRAYSLGMLFMILAGIHFYKFMYSSRRPLYLFLTGLFSAAAVLTHFLSVYVVLVFLAWIVFTARSSLLSWRNVAAVALPILIVVAYFHFSFAGVVRMKPENEIIRQQMASAFSLSEVLLRSARLSASDFRVVFPAFRATNIVTLFSFALVVALYIGAVRLAGTAEEKRRLHLLFTLGASATVFLAFVSVTAGHYSLLYLRYHSFGVPFACLFTACAIAVLLASAKRPKLLQVAILCTIVIPCGALLAALIKNYRPDQRYSHVAVAKEIVSDGIVKVAVPEWTDAFVVHSLLPKGYQIRYVRNRSSPHFILHAANGQTRDRLRIRR